MFKSLKRLVIIIAIIGSLYTCKDFLTNHNFLSMTPLQLIEQSTVPSNRRFKKSQSQNHVSATYKDNIVTTYDTPNKGDKRWKTNKVTVYIDPNQKSKYIDAYKNAINLWNSYNLFYFDLVDDKTQANVYLTHKNLDQSIQYETESTYYVTMGVTDINYYTDYNYIASATVYFNDLAVNDPTQHYTQDKLNSVAAHELGHALGLEHVNKDHTLMYWKTNDNYSNAIDDSTLTNVKKLYKEN